MEDQRSRRRASRLGTSKVASQSGFLLGSCCVAADTCVRACISVFACAGAHAAAAVSFNHHLFRIFRPRSLCVCLRIRVSGCAAYLSLRPDCGPLPPPRRLRILFCALPLWARLALAMPVTRVRGWKVVLDAHAPPFTPPILPPPFRTVHGLLSLSLSFSFSR